MSINPMLLCDFYKTTHSRQFPKGTTELTSYFTPRMSRLTGINSIVVFGVQAFCQEYLIDYFDEHFFRRNLADVTDEIETVLDNTIGKKNYDSTKFVDLYNLGYLPVEINALPKGTLCPIHVPFLEMKNTHPDFAWVPQFLESLISAELWHPMISATVGHLYRQIVDEYYDKTCDDSTPRGKALGDFSFRGQECLQSAVKSSAGWCLSFLNTATVPAIPYLEKNYYCDASLEPVAYGSVSTEHSVMCSNFAVDGYANQQLRRLQNALAHDHYPQDEKEKHILSTCKSVFEDFRLQHKDIPGDAVRLYIDKGVTDGMDTEIFIDCDLKHYPLRSFKQMNSDLGTVIGQYAKLGKRNSKKDDMHLNKHAMHLVRLYLMCFDILEKGEINTYREDDRDFLLEIRGGKFQKPDGTYYQEFFDIINDYEKRLEYDKKNTSLPPNPDYKRIEEFVMEVNTDACYLVPHHSAA